jgi:hypothetical protein
MQKQKAVGLIGSLILILGVFMPIVRIPFAGSINYFHNGQGDGSLVLVLALLSLLLIIRGRYEWLLTTGFGSLAIEIFTFVNLRMRLDTAQAATRAKLADNPFRGIAEAAMSAVQIEWGWIVLVVGSGTLITAAFLRDAGPLKDCPYCAEKIQAAARLCRYCNRELVTHDRFDVAVVTAAEVEAMTPRISAKVIVVTMLLVMVLPASLWLISLFV